MLEKQLKKESEILIFCLIFFLFFIGCVEEKTVSEQGIDFASEFQSIQSLYTEAGLSSEEIQRIDSKQLLDEKERNELNQELVALEQKIEEFRLRVGAFPEQREKSALLAFTQLELIRVNYFKAMVELKNSESFNEVIQALASFDFTDLLSENKCLALEKADTLKESYLRAQNSAEALKNHINLFNSSFPELSQTARVEERTPLLEQTKLQEFIESSIIVFEGCNALIQSMVLLSRIEQAAQEQNLCFSLKKLDESIKSLEVLALQLDSVSERAASLKELNIDSKLLDEERKMLLSISTEFKEFQKQLKEECE